MRRTGPSDYSLSYDLRNMQASAGGAVIMERGDPTGIGPFTRKQWRELICAGWEYDSHPEERGHNWRHWTADAWSWIPLTQALSRERADRRDRRQCESRTSSLSDRLIQARARKASASYIRELQVILFHASRPRIPGCAASRSAVTTEDAVAGEVREVAFADRRERAVRTESA